MATLQALEDWLIKITEHTRRTAEALEGRAGANSPGGGAGAGGSGSMLDRLGRRIEEALRSGLAQGLAQARALERRGFGGTLEQARFDYAMDQLSKQFAAVMMPVMNAMTYTAAQIELRMRRMGGSEQNRLMGTLIGAGVGFRYGGAPGAILGGLAGNAFMGGPGSTEGALAGGASGALVGYRYGGAYGAAVGAGVGTFVGSGGPGRYNAARAGGASQVGAAAESGLGDIISAIPRALANRTNELALTDRIAGRPMLIADLGTSPNQKAEDKRRDVTPFSAEQMEAGGTAARIQQNIIRVTTGAGYEEDMGPFGEFVKAILSKIDELIRVVNPAYQAPEPRSAMDARPS